MKADFKNSSSMTGKGSNSGECFHLMREAVTFRLVNPASVVVQPKGPAVPDVNFPVVFSDGRNRAFLCSGPENGPGRKGGPGRHVAPGPFLASKSFVGKLAVPEA